MKRQFSVKRVPAELDVLRFPAYVDRLVTTECLNCSTLLSVSQPDLDAPDKLLGVCDRCKHWFFIHLRPDRTEGVMCELPDVDLIRQLSLDDPADNEQISDHREDELL